jgi:2-(3-amino-3-carboxypropyl)histidine synthase
MNLFDFEEDQIKRTIIDRGAKRVLIQLPEGLKPQALFLAEHVMKSGALPIISADPCYGACDLPLRASKKFGVDLLLHFGHVPFVGIEPTPTVYFDVKSKIDVIPVIKKVLPKLHKWLRIGLATTIQHVHILNDVKKFLLEHGKKVLIGTPNDLKYLGQVIGCNYSSVNEISKNVEAFLFIGGGCFHALGIGLSTLKPTIVADPFSNNVFSVEKETQKILRQRFASINKAKGGKIFGVLIGKKTGQNNFELAISLKKLLEKDGRTVFLLLIGEITPVALSAFPKIDVFVNTACPRISLDDASKFRKPVLIPSETLVLVGARSWAELCHGGLFSQKN